MHLSGIKICSWLYGVFILISSRPIKWKKKKKAGVLGMHYVSEWLIIMNIFHMKLSLAIKLTFVHIP